MRVPHNSYVLVADGRKMLFFTNEGDAYAPNLRVVRMREKENPPHFDQATDLAGRAANTTDRRGGSFEEVDFHQLEEDRFASDVAEMLKTRALANEYEKLIIVAPPKTLGELRKHYHKEVEHRITGELAKDLTRHPVSEIERILSSE